MESARRNNAIRWIYPIVWITLLLYIATPVYGTYTVPVGKTFQVGNIRYSFQNETNLTRVGINTSCFFFDDMILNIKSTNPANITINSFTKKTINLTYCCNNSSSLNFNINGLLFFTKEYTNTPQTMQVSIPDPPKTAEDITGNDPFLDFLSGLMPLIVIIFFLILLLSMIRVF